jgi:hypothetical protein
MAATSGGSSTGLGFELDADFAAWAFVDPSAGFAFSSGGTFDGSSPPVTATRGVCAGAANFGTRSPAVVVFG